MEVIEFLVVAVLGLILVFAMAVFGALVGAFCGWIVGFTPLGVWILNFLSAAHIETNMVDLGAFFGFVGGFFKESINVSKN
jgi:hypothetical protein